MRLIDVDVYCATICRCNRRECDKAKCPIHNAPTAYDVDKVVEELEKLADNSNDYMHESYFDGKEDGIREAIEIVKQGGVGKDTL